MAINLDFAICDFQIRGVDPPVNLGCCSSLVLVLYKQINLRYPYNSFPYYPSNLDPGLIAISQYLVQQYLKPSKNLGLGLDQADNEESREC